MATLSLRRLWTIYKRTAVHPGQSKRNLARTQLAFYSACLAKRWCAIEAAVLKVEQS
jgi:hypothetical protein